MGGLIGGLHREVVLDPSLDEINNGLVHGEICHGSFDQR